MFPIHHPAWDPAFYLLPETPCSVLLFPVQGITNGAAMKDTNRISPIVWAIAVIGITILIFLAWMRPRQHPATPQPEQSSLPTAPMDPVTPGVHRNLHFTRPDRAVQTESEDHTLRGIVTTAEGLPVAGASVAATSGKPGVYVWLRESNFYSPDPTVRLATTDEHGAFSLSSPPEHGTVMAIADAGFGSNSIAQVRTNQVVVLHAFGRIEGTLKIAGAPSVGEGVSFYPSVSGLMANSKNFKATTDDHGHFTLEKIPPGDGSIARLIKAVPNMWLTSDGTPVTVQSGQTTPVTLGDSGAVLRGTVRFELAPNDEQLTFIGRISRARPNLSAFKSTAEALAYMNSPEWQAQTKKVKNYSFVVTADGTFQADSVAPGTYTIEVSGRSTNDPAPFFNAPLVQGAIQFTVPDSADPMTPISVGEIVLTPTAAFRRPSVNPIFQ
jgi:hypothetical protein